MNYFVPTLGGLELIAPDEARIHCPLVHGQLRDEHVLALIAALARPGLFIDAGAKIGLRSVFVAKSHCDVVAMESEPSLRRYLESNVRRNGLGDRIRVVEGAVAGHRGNAGGLEADTIDSLGVSPDVIHVDVEGHELEVLRGATTTLARSRPAVLVNTGAQAVDISRLLGELGYRRLGGSVTKISTFLFVARPEHRRIAAPFVANQRRRRLNESTRKILKRIPIVGAALPRVKTLLGGLAHAVSEGAAIRRLRAGMRAPVRLDAASEVVVSLTSFPARIDHVWIAIESLLQQDVPPRKVVLVLAEPEFPGRRVPEELRRQEKRGLEILWTSRNTRSYKKLLPTREAYPQATIVTADDDVLYEPHMLSALQSAARQWPNAIVGHTGAVVTAGKKSLLPYRQWPNADRSTPVGRVLLTGNGGILYPPNVMPIDLLGNYELAEQLCPTGDDIWFWSVARQAGVPVMCLGNHALHMLRYQHATPQLATLNWDQDHNDQQLRNVFEYFGFFDTFVDDAAGQNAS